MWRHPPPLFFCIMFWRGLSVSHLRVCHCPSVRTIGLALAWLHCLHPPLNMLQAPCPSGPTPHGSIHPIERWGTMCGPHCWPVRTWDSFVIFSYTFLFFLRAQQWGASGWSWPLIGRKDVRTRLCLFLVRLVDWLTTIHDHWFTGCAFGRWAPDKFRDCFPNIVQRRFSVHCN